jgi:sterol desaturase/sphingolipid hydroxylase (fatty acid hydroxylase superfamily)
VGFLSTPFAISAETPAMSNTLVSNAIGLIQSAASSLWTAAEILFYSAVWLCGLALLVKGKEAIVAARKAAKEIRLNLSILVVDVLLVTPLVGLLVGIVRAGVAQLPFVVVDSRIWDAAGLPGTLFAVVFVGDFFSYWRHRLEHTPLLWPAHAIHHSDTEMTWLTLGRFHPIDRIVTSTVDIALLALLGFPGWALIFNEFVRHYYGEFIHADFPWTYGPLGRVFVSPVMHRWHHARDVVGAGSNFATVFSVFDQAFKTYHVPGLCTVPLGVTDDIAPGLMGQLRFPLVAWARAYLPASFKSDASQDVQEIGV